MKNIYLLLLLVISVNNTYATNNTANLNNKESNIGQLVKTIIDSQVWNLDSLPDVESGPSHRMGEALSHGDYNDDGFQDLAIGIPSYSLGGTLNNVGVVVILFGTANGLSSDDFHLLFQLLEPDANAFESLNGIEANDFFGTSLASGDFNCDGITDLAVGTPNEDAVIGGELREDVGVVNIFYGSDDGFDLADGSTFLFQTEIEDGDRFGWSMAVGDFNGDVENGNSCYDLAVSAPFEDLNSNTNSGLVYTYYGTSAGLSGGNFDRLHQGILNIDGLVESHDQFGFSLAAGRFGTGTGSGSSGGIGVGGDAFDDLVVGIPGEEINEQINAGAVQIFYGSSEGFAASSNIINDIWSQDSPGIIGIPEVNDRFGRSLAVGNFNGFGLDDLAIGVPREDLDNDGITNAGAVNVIYGSVLGLTSANNRIFHQNIDGIDGDAENEDRFGLRLTGGDLNGDSIDDLVIGVPRENNSRGAFHIIYGSSDGITTDDSLFERNTGDGEASDEMGYAMTVADFGNGTELAVGIPGDDSADGDNNAGSVEVFKFLASDIIFKDSFEE